MQFGGRRTDRSLQTACVRRAIGRAETAIAGRCQPLPTCGLYLGGLPAVLDLIITNVAAPYANPSSNPYSTP
jgi:hypothetical protein